MIMSFQIIPKLFLLPPPNITLSHPYHQHAPRSWLLALSERSVLFGGHNSATIPPPLHNPPSQTTSRIPTKPTLQQLRRVRAIGAIARKRAQDRDAQVRQAERVASLSITLHDRRVRAHYVRTVDHVPRSRTCASEDGQVSLHATRQSLELHCHRHIARGVIHRPLPNLLTYGSILASDPVERADLFRGTDGSGRRESGAREKGYDMIRRARVGLGGVRRELNQIRGPGDIWHGETFERRGVGGTPDVA